MKLGHGKAGVVLVLALILAIPACFTFTFYYSLSEADFLSKQLKLEPRDQVELLTGVQDKSKALVPVNLNHLVFLGGGLCRHLPVTSCHICSPTLTIPILRC